MRFALLGDHPDGLQMARALIETGRHELAAHPGPAVHPPGASGSQAGTIGGSASTIGDVEEILADPAIEAIIVAGDASQRPQQLRRALQSEHHVLCVFPPDQKPDVAYEAAMIQADTRRVLLPILTGALHPAIPRLRTMIQTAEPGCDWLIQWDQRCPSQPNNRAKEKSLAPYFPGWEILQALGGSIAEISAFAEHAERMIDEPLLIAGRFEKGGIFQATWIRNQESGIRSQESGVRRWRLRLTMSALEAELDFPSGIGGPATLTWRGETESCQKEQWPAHNLFHEMVKVFEDAVRLRGQESGIRGQESNSSLLTPDSRLLTTEPSALVTWQDAIRCAELDDAARRSVERRRASTLEYPEATEEAGFKGTMTLIGCGMLWLMVVLLVLSRWYPILLVVIVLMLTIFLGLQLLRLIVRK